MSNSRRFEIPLSASTDKFGSFSYENDPASNCVDATGYERTIIKKLYKTNN